MWQYSRNLLTPGTRHWPVLTRVPRGYHLRSELGYPEIGIRAQVRPTVAVAALFRRLESVPPPTLAGCAQSQ
jgi:hypothetical protein